MLGRRDGVAHRRVHDDDTVPGRSLDVDIVDTDPGPAYDLQPAGAFEQFSRNLRCRTDCKSLILSDHLLQGGLVSSEFRPEIGFDAAVAEDLQRSFRQLV